MRSALLTRQMTQAHNKKASPDWLIQGVLTKIGDIFDSLTGRRWKPSSSLATSQLIERLKFLLDSEAVDGEGGRKYVPHNIKLKMQWDKFAADSEEALTMLRNEFLVAAIDHINDRRYYTRAPISIEVKPDYFTEGVRLFASFEAFPDDHEEAQINVSLPGDTDEPAESVDVEVPTENRSAFARFTLNQRLIEKNLTFVPGGRLSVGRTKENDLAIDDISVSKYHASLLLDTEGRLVVADTGSTNGTFINGERISYGKAATVGTGDMLKFGAIDVAINVAPPPEAPKTPDATVEFSHSETVGGFEFKKREPVNLSPIESGQKTEVLTHDARPTELIPAEQPAPTMPAISVNPQDDGEREPEVR